MAAITRLRRQSSGAAPVWEIKPDSPLQGDFIITDTAAVVIRALGLTAPANWEAKLPEVRLLSVFGPKGRT
ncbi:hypothetical protein [Paenibacillus sp. LHD-38]|uniref:hypothetical protein n=1 Tax=Paenibacillus sp. LHD-38 TaxID=3072143 RepID=UPI00280F3262|nr:hypothetical protein [Paenibacillus sp. LHD-38]MDQ8737634.1 hypothetical protein [Paenibacillus sp. LHD-38]